MKRFLTFLAALSLAACDDGDLTLERLNFDDTVVETPCGELLLYKIGSSREESLMIELQGESAEIFNTLPADGQPREYTINNSGVKALYRIFDGEVNRNYFCNEIPPIAPLVIEEWFATGGTVEIATNLEADDNDNLPASLEGIVVNPDGTINREASQDTDGDGLPDYLDIDDDGDNVLTSQEIEITNTDIVFTDTDGDGIPNYLDTDDDNDGVNTIDEDLNGDNNPANDIEVGNTEPNYLIASLNIATTLPVSRRTHNFIETYTSTIAITDGFQLINGSQEVKYDVPRYEFGTVTVEVTTAEQQASEF
ncbi:hypothetical protein E7Z59_12080 [Robertkochia marina]|uniref:Calcium-binding protein n=1 Tax=Robertkochia marina TaxID=1227945 RepID=A0A4S3M0J7_9FLAO|nr:hypothetical protein [Robertkochia marina]THD66527.1 hypothetical protein E7Z59_12080 [Robertkochia marina]TRZ45631.1 hypothetical protein D3A96_06550 [Robertkochia marina]